MGIDLHLDWASYDAAKYACEHWHYSRCMPAGKLVKVGVWEAGKFIGVVIFGRGANNHIGSPYDLSQLEVCELVRIALTEHVAPVSRIASIAVKFLRKQSPGLRLIISYADPMQNHHGGIYQAMGWIYAGETKPERKYLVNGRWMHKRTVSSKFGTYKQLHLTSSRTIPKHLYLYPLDSVMRTQIAPMAKPYPKRGASIDSDAVGDQPIQGGAIPTAPLQIEG